MSNDDHHCYLIDHWYDAEREIHWYHVGYSSDPVYAEFYKWQRSAKLHYEYEDMPHDYFVFLHDADRLEMHRRFADHISPQIEVSIWLEDFRDYTKPVDKTSEAYIFGTMLQEAITEEIDAEILRSIGMPPAQ